MPGISVREADTSCEAEGINIDVVVIATTFPLEELAQVRVHPELHWVPVVLVAPGQALPRQDWRSLNVWPTTVTGAELLEELTGVLAHLLAAASHPSSGHHSCLSESA